MGISLLSPTALFDESTNYHIKFASTGSCKPRSISSCWPGHWKEWQRQSTTYSQVSCNTKHTVANLLLSFLSVQAISRTEGRPLTWIHTSSLQWSPRLPFCGNRHKHFFVGFFAFFFPVVSKLCDGAITRLCDGLVWFFAFRLSYRLPNNLWTFCNNELLCYS